MNLLKELKQDFLSIFPTPLDKMKLNMWTMSFDRLTEEAYWEDRIDKEISQKRIGLILSVVIYLMLSLTDMLIAPEVKDLIWMFRFTLFIPLTLVVYILTHLSTMKKYLHLMMAGLMFVASLGQTFALMQMPLEGLRLGVLTIGIFFVLGFFVLRTKFTYALVAMLASYGVFLAYIFTLSLMATNERLSSLLITLAMFVTTAFGGYMGEYIKRRNHHLVISASRNEGKSEGKNKGKKDQVKEPVKEQKPVIRTVESPVNRLFEEVSDVVWFINLEGEIKYISSSVKEFLGYEPDELIGKRAVLMMTNDAYAQFDQSAQRLYRDKNIVRASYEYKTKAGLIKTGEAFVKKHSDKRFGEGYVGSTRPMTDEQLAKEEGSAKEFKRLKEELESVKHTKGQLVTELDDLKSKIRLVHEEQDKRIEVPMDAMAQALEKVAEHYTDLIKVQLEAHDRELAIISSKYSDMTMSKFDLENYFTLAKRKIHMTANSLDVLADRIFLFNQYLKDKDDLNVQSYALRSLLEESVLKLKHFFKNSKHIIEIDCPRSVDIDIDKSLFEHVINNMIINSLTFSFANLRNGKISIGVEVVDGQVLITYKDDGEKIKADDIDEMFASIINQDTNALEGMELHMVRKIIETHMSGSIGCEYNNQKNTFKLVFPQKQ